jgi:hypothetical protein
MVSYASTQGAQPFMVLQMIVFLIVRKHRWVVGQEGILYVATIIPQNKTVCSGASASVLTFTKRLLPSMGVQCVSRWNLYTYRTNFNTYTPSGFNKHRMVSGKIYTRNWLWY